jgi:hypothetical protein
MTDALSSTIGRRLRQDPRQRGRQLSPGSSPHKQHPVVISVHERSDGRSFVSAASQGCKDAPRPDLFPHLGGPHPGERRGAEGGERSFSRKTAPAGPSPKNQLPPSATAHRRWQRRGELPPPASSSRQQGADGGRSCPSPPAARSETPRARRVFLSRGVSPACGERSCEGLGGQDGSGRRASPDEESLLAKALLAALPDNVLLLARRKAAGDPPLRCGGAGAGLSGRGCRQPEDTKIRLSAWGGPSSQSNPSRRAPGNDRPRG